MRGLEHEVLRRSDELGLAARVAAPEQEHDRLLVVVQLFDHVVGEGRPAEVLVAVRLSGADGERSVEHENALLCPLGERTVLGRLDAEVAFQLLEDVLEARRQLDARLHGKAEAVRLTGAVVGVLPENDRLDRGIGRQAECIKDVFHRRINRVFGVFLLEKVADALVVVLFELAGEDFVPVVAKMNHR